FTNAMSHLNMPPITVASNNLAGGKINISTTQFPSQPNSIQQVTLPGPPKSGTFTLSMPGQTTIALPYNASAAQVQSALESLLAIVPGNCTVVALGDSKWTVEFHGTLAGIVQPFLR